MKLHVLSIVLGLLAYTAGDPIAPQEVSDYNDENGVNYEDPIAPQEVSDYNDENGVNNEGYESVGCYIDSRDRAINGDIRNVPKVVAIKTCYLLAKAAGNKYFAVQHDHQCFTSADAGDTYYKHGKGEGCTEGRGGNWRNSVYKVKEYKSVGCFVDQPDRAIVGTMKTFPTKTVIKSCYSLAKEAGNKYFAVQYDTQCFTSATAGDSYNKYGEGNGCTDGRGGYWRNSVYKLTDFPEFQGYKSVGCFWDFVFLRAIGDEMKVFQRETIKSCYKRAKNARFQYFAVQNDKECFTSADAERTYYIYGATDGCNDGRGSDSKNSVYKLTGDQVFQDPIALQEVSYNDESGVNNEDPIAPQEVSYDYNDESGVNYEGYDMVGCFVDKPVRAIRGEMKEFRETRVVNSCFLRAKAAGNKYFAVQHHNQCFTSRDAGVTYNRYGSDRGCPNGRGGSWFNTVYKLTGFKSVGCYRDKPDRAISGDIESFPKETIIQSCYSRAKAAGNNYFSVQNDDQCFTSADAEGKYGKYGATTGCKHGRGRGWKNNVYKLTGIQEVQGYESVGCFVDRYDRAIGGGQEYFPKETVINSCYLRAKAAGNKYFAVQYDTQCFTSGDAGQTYNKYGETTGCEHRRGGGWKNSVYKLTVYESVGCYKDKHNRAIGGGLKEFPKETVINSCYLRAKAAGNKYFSVQYDKQCFTSADAEGTYGKYGETTGCEHGRGGTWKSSVYKLTGFQEVQDELKINDYAEGYHQYSEAVNDI